MLLRFGRPQKSVTACVLWVEPKGKRRNEKRGRFGTFTSGLLKLSDWLRESGVTHVAIESTAVYWKPVWNVLDGQFEEVLLVNAQHIKAVPGRKTDQKDSSPKSHLRFVSCSARCGSCPG